MLSSTNHLADHSISTTTFSRQHLQRQDIPVGRFTSRLPSPIVNPSPRPVMVHQTLPIASWLFSRSNSCPDLDTTHVHPLVHFYPVMTTHATNVIGKCSDMVLVRNPVSCFFCLCVFSALTKIDVARIPRLRNSRKMARRGVEYSKLIFLLLCVFSD